MKTRIIDELGNRFPALGKFCPNWLPTAISEFRANLARSDLPGAAGSLAFTTVLSLVPVLAVSFYVFKLFGGLDYAYDKVVWYLLDVLSEGTGVIVAEHLDNFIHQVHAKAVGWAGVGGLSVTAVMTYLTIVRTFNRIWGVEGRVELRHRVRRAFVLLTVGPILLAASIAITTAVAAEVKGIPFSSQVIAYALTTLLFTMVYSLVPSTRVSFKVTALGSLVPAGLLEGAKFGYAIYTSRMVSYSTFYGSFAAIPLFLLWIYIGWYITLLGAVWIRTLESLVSKGRSG